MNVSRIERGDIVQFRYPKDPERFYVKRIIGLPGDTVEIKDGGVFVNGALIDEPYIDPEYNQVKLTLPPQVIPSGHYYVLGDNRDNSSDSRYWGTVEEGLIEGRLYWKYASGQRR